jgi:hypothetical protein
MTAGKDVKMPVDGVAHLAPVVVTLARPRQGPTPPGASSGATAPPRRRSHQPLRSALVGTALTGR